VYKSILKKSFIRGIVSAPPGSAVSVEAASIPGPAPLGNLSEPVPCCSKDLWDNRPLPEHDSTPLGGGDEPFPESSFISLVEEERNAPVLGDSIEKTTFVEVPVMPGFRVVHVASLINSLMNSHESPYDCHPKHLRFVKEVRSGLEVVLHFSCSLCGHADVRINAAGEDGVTRLGAKSKLNKRVVRGIVSAGTYIHQNYLPLLTGIIRIILYQYFLGVGHTVGADIFTAINVPFLSEGLFYKIEQDLEVAAHDITERSMNLAAAEERKHAIANNSVSNTGKPMITVVADGAWCKRSYRHSYNALSGCVSITVIKPFLPI